MDINGTKLWDRVYLLTLLFIGLKLAGEIDWSWWWVFSPVLITLGIGAFFLLLAFFLGMAIKRTSAWSRMQQQAKLRARAARGDDVEKAFENLS